MLKNFKHFENLVLDKNFKFSDFVHFMSKLRYVDVYVRTILAGQLYK